MSKQYDSKMDYTLNLGKDFSGFKKLFLFELSKITPISSYAHYFITGSFAIAKTFDDYKSTTH